MARSVTVGMICATMSLLGSGCAGCPEESGSDGDSYVAGDEETAEAAQAFGSGSCGTATADYTTTHGFFGDQEHTSPRSYNTCYKGYVVDITDYQYYHDGTHVLWGDTNATTQTDCQNQFMRVYLYKRKSSGNVLLTTLEGHGTWITSTTPDRCNPPSFSIGSYFTPGNDHRIAVTARPWDSSAAPTRKVHFHSLIEF